MTNLYYIIRNFFMRMFRIKRTLKGTWTIDIDKDLKKFHGIDVEDELMNMMIDEIREKLND